MLRWKLKVRKMTYLFIDIISILIAFLIADLLYGSILEGKLVVSGFEQFSFVMLFVLFYIISSLISNVYEATIENYGNCNLNIIGRMLFAFTTAEVFIAALMFYMNVELSRIFLMTFSITILVIVSLNRVLIYMVNRRKGAYKNNRNILLVGHSGRGERYIDEIRKHEYLDVNIMGYVSIKEDIGYDNLITIGSLDDLSDIVSEYVVDEVAVARPLSYDERLSDVLSSCQNMGVTVTMLLETRNKDAHAQVAMVGDLPVLKFHTVSLNETQIFIKRLIDVCGAIIGMILFGIAYVFLAPLIKLETPGPVIFKQYRVGKNGRIFKVWKFRSMGVNAEREKAALLASNEMSGHMFKMTNDPRVTKVGGFIRKTSIDELPQFYNVLKGDMSLVGTRPPTISEVSSYENPHRKRISITPGITGIWQVSGRSDIEDFEEVVRLDNEYIKNWSLWMDLKILFKTIVVVFSRRGSR